MSNPNPAHNPTDGLGSACYVQLSGTGVTALHTPSTNHPNSAPYTVNLSLSSAGGLSSSVVVTPTLVDVSNTAYSATAASWVFKSYNNPQITETTFSSLAPSIAYTAKIASTSADGNTTCTVTGLAKGQAIVEFIYPTFDNTEGNISTSTGVSGGVVSTQNVPKDRIYAQLIVNVGV